MHNEKSKKFKEFKRFLQAAGAEIIEPTSIFEVLRFKANGTVGVVYQNQHGVITKFFNEAEKALQAFQNNKPYSANEVSKRVKRNYILNTLLKRDGTDCFYCGKEMKEGQETIEHLFSINQGGRNHIANLALAHYECNRQASHMPVVEKVKLRDRLRSN